MTDGPEDDFDFKAFMAQLPMEQLAINCPVNGKRVFIGVEIAEGDAIPHMNGTISCSACRATHRFTPRDVYTVPQSQM